MARLKELETGSEPLKDESKIAEIITFINEADLEKNSKTSPILQRHFLTSLVNKEIPPIPDESEKKIWPQTLKHPILYIFFWWLIPLLKVGYKRTLQNEDLWALKDNMKVETLYNVFKKHLNMGIAENQAKFKKNHAEYTEKELDDASFTKLTLPGALIKTLGWKYLAAIALILIFDLASTFSPLLTKALVNYVGRKATDPSLGSGEGVAYAVGEALILLLSNVAYNHAMNLAANCALETNAILMKALLEKSFNLSIKSKQTYNVGKITSILGGDLSRLEMAINLLMFVVTFPVPIVVIISLLIVNIGLAALVGIAILLTVTVAIMFLSTTQVGLREKASEQTDKRVGLVSEVLNSIKMIKFYSWEKPYHERIAKHRSQEMKSVFKLHFIRIFFISSSLFLPTVCSIASFLVMHALSPNRSVGSIFASVSLFSMISEHLVIVPLSLGSTLDAYVAFNRITDFLKSGEEERAVKQIEDEEKEINLEFDDSMAIQIKNAEFQWEKVDLEEIKDDEENDDKAESASLTNDKVERSLFDASTFTGLHNIDVGIKKGEFVIITGGVGSGKTSLLNAIAGIMKKKSGVLQVNDSLLSAGYPWIQNATIKENVIFGEPYNEAWYHSVVKACSLAVDLKELPGGDLTEVGERGITLSGGQKARINLARAVYNKKEIILLDDVLSAVDAKVGKHIMEHCFLGLLKEKTRILATHQLSLIESADKVIYLDNTGHAHVGTTEELLSSNEEFVRLMEFYQKPQELEGTNKETQALACSETNEKKDINLVDAENNGDSVLRKRNVKIEDEIAKQKREEEEIGLGNSEEGKLVEAEEKAVNKIKWNVYKNFFTETFSKAPLLFIVLTFAEFSIATFLYLFTNTWLSFWTDKRFPTKSTGFYMGIYVMVGVLSLVFSFIQFAIITYVCNETAKRLNIKAVERILYTPMSFLDTTPIGRILNRFTADTDVLDNELGEQIRLMAFTFCIVIGTFILCIIYLPWIAIAIPPLALIVVSITSFYQASAREVKRLEAVNRSLVYNNFNECLNGMSTIKAYKKQSSFLRKNDKFINKLNGSSYVTLSVQRFFAISFELLAFVYILLITLLCVTRAVKISASSAGLVLSYALEVVSLLTGFLKYLTLVESGMNSVERLMFYAYEVPQEAPHEIPEKKPSQQWPQHGAIEFKNVDFRYRENLPLVLKNLTFNIHSVEKIGICGRTGAGKSSIMSALYRLCELDNGQIIIDGVDISELGLHDLRSKLCIIPQDPALFKGTIRKNLDPFGYSTDNELWDSLRRSGLIDSSLLEQVKTQTIQNENLETIHRFHLSQQVQEEGTNFSLGERQLIALSRALIRKTKILVMDEAASSVDYETDAKINHTIRTEFKDCTILCIAHRLNTILNYDRILVMDKGAVREFDTPSKLFRIEGGIFREMCLRSNISQTNFSM